MVRDGPEIGSTEVVRLSHGTLIRSIEETINSDGTMRVHIIQPSDGWISKLKHLVEKVGPFGASGATTAPVTVGFASNGDASESLDERGVGAKEPPRSDWAALEAVDDDMEQWNGSELFRRDDRLFEGMQGSQYKRFRDGKSEADACEYNRRIRITGYSSYGAAI